MDYQLGIDAGSTTVKLVVLDKQGKSVFQKYERHYARVKEILLGYFQQLRLFFPKSRYSVAVTGSVGMAVAELLRVNFVQEVIAAAVYTKSCYPQVKTLIDIGGEDSKVIFLDGLRPDLRMNGNCAGGTGAFIDQMSTLQGISNLEMDERALRAERIYSIAARCGVFAKTDVQNLMSQNVDSCDVAASIFHSIAVQTVTALCRGRKIIPSVLACGGPLTFLPALRKAFIDYLGLEPEQFLVDADSCLIPARGCAMQASGESVEIDELERRLFAGKTTVVAQALPRLFADEQEYENWKAEKVRYAIKEKQLTAGKMTVALGIDSGSTTTKIIALTPQKEIVFRFYTMNLGDPIAAVKKGLTQLREQAEKERTELKIIASCSTGYGENLLKAALGLDFNIIETVAHFKAANSLLPNVSFILDIGGQDMKAIFVEQGAIVRMELNEACSSGCGTFLQTLASTMGHDVQGFAKLACQAENPCNLGSRCTVFMNSKIKQVMREGAAVSDISAGLSYSVIKNCLHKVLNLQEIDSLGENIILQGGTMRNDSVVRAFEQLSGKNVVCSNMPEMMGAYGCALHALENCRGERSIVEFLQPGEFRQRRLQCSGCENRCGVICYIFPNGNSYYSGNKCETVFSNQGKSRQKGVNFYAKKYELLFSRPVNDRGRRIGIPRALNMYEEYPFWHALFTACGFQVVLSDESNMREYEAEVGTVMAENICFPAKLTHSHIRNLERRQVERIFMPYVVYEPQVDKRDVNSYNCPIVSGYSDVIASCMQPGVALDSPVITMADEKRLQKQVVGYLATLGIDKKNARQAFSQAMKARQEYERLIGEYARTIVAEAREKGKIVIVLAGRPYHTDPLIQHKLSDMIANLGAYVVSDDVVRGIEKTILPGSFLVRQWAFVNRIVRVAEWTARQGKDVQLVHLTSFGCGPDAFIQDEIRHILHRFHKPYTLLKIDDVSNTGSLRLRIRSLLESMSREETKNVLDEQTTRNYVASQDRERILLAPHISEYLTPFLPPLFYLAGNHKLEVLPPSDEKSAALGLQYAHNELCYPATLVTGDIIKALQSGRYDLNKVAIIMSQTGGQCRATNYAAVMKRAMIAAGFETVPFVTLGVTTQSDYKNKQDRFIMAWKKILPQTINSFIYGDVIAKMYYPSVVREKEKGQAQALRDYFLKKGANIIAKKNSAALLIAYTKEAAGAFSNICYKKETEKVGIVGEIFLKFSHFAHQNLLDVLIEREIEVVPPLLTPFFFQDFVNIQTNKALHLSGSIWSTTVTSLLYQYVKRQIGKFNQAASDFSYYRPFSDIYEDAQLIKNIISPAAQFGEGWVLPAEVCAFAESGIYNVLSFQPFGCIANQIISKGVENALCRKYPQLNLLSIDFDSGVSAVNVMNRLVLFLESA